MTHIHELRPLLIEAPVDSGLPVLDVGEVEVGANSAIVVALPLVKRRMVLLPKAVFGPGAAVVIDTHADVDEVFCRNGVVCSEAGHAHLFHAPYRDSCVPRVDWLRCRDVLIWVTTYGGWNGEDISSIAGDDGGESASGVVLRDLSAEVVICK